MRKSSSRTKQEESAKLKRDVEEFQRQGGVIQQVQVTDNKWYRDLQKKRKPHVPMTITQARRHHQWRSGGIQLRS